MTYGYGVNVCCIQLQATKDLDGGMEALWIIRLPSKLIRHYLYWFWYWSCQLVKVVHTFLRRTNVNMVVSKAKFALRHLSCILLICWGISAFWVPQLWVRSFLCARMASRVSSSDNPHLFWVASLFYHAMWLFRAIVSSFNNFNVIGNAF